MATSGYSTMGGSSSGGHLAGELVEAEGESLEGKKDGCRASSDLMDKIVPPSSGFHNHFDRQPSPVATVPPGVVASSVSITNAVETDHSTKATQPLPPPPPPKPSRMTVDDISGRRQNSELDYSVHVSF